MNYYHCAFEPIISLKGGCLLLLIKRLMNDYLLTNEDAQVYKEDRLEAN